jgi:SAM-dependent methyltransferase
MPPPPIEKAERAGERAPGLAALGGYAFVRGDDESIDLAKTQKFERRREPSIHDDDDDPPDVPHADDDDRISGDFDNNRATPTRRRKGKKGRRRTVKIPDDNVPSTPSPSGVAPLPPPPPRAELSTLVPGRSPADAKAAPAKAGTHTSPFALIEEDDIYDAPTIMREPPSEPQARLAALGDPALPDPTADSTDDEAHERLSALEPPPSIKRESAPGIYTDDTAISVLRPIQIVSDLPAVVPEPPESVEPEPEPYPPPPPARDDHPHTQRRPPPPPPRARMNTDAPEGSLDDIEEIIPERMSLPGPAVHHLPTDSSPGEASPRRPLPPPRVAEHSRPPDALPDHPVSVEVPPRTPLPRSVEPRSVEARSVEARSVEPRATTEAEADLALAEARLREAEALAAVAEARAREAAAKAEAAARKTARPPKKPWFQEIFEDELIRTMDNPKRKDVEREANYIEKSLRLDRGSRLLDLCCGTGVHAVELASRGYQVVGVDLSNTMLTLARDHNEKRGTSVSFIQGDMRRLNLEGVFDGIYCWQTSFGYFDDQQNAEVLERVARALRPGGVFVLDVTNRDFVAPRAPTMAWFEKQGVVCMDEARFDFFTSRLITKRMVLFDTGRSCEIEMSIRLYTLTELGRLLQKVGFEVLEVSGHRAHRGAYFGAESARIMITAKRKDDEG